MAICRLRFLELRPAEWGRRRWRERWPANRFPSIGGAVRNHFQSYIFFVLTTALLVLSGCNINVKKDSNDKDENKKVDIDTPFGGIHVSKGADVRDTGLPVYPSAKPKTKGDSDDDDKSANVDISTSSFGVKVVAIQYETKDAPAKVTAFYKDKLKQYGNVLEC